MIYLQWLSDDYFVIPTTEGSSVAYNSSCSTEDPSVVGMTKPVSQNRIDSACVLTMNQPSSLPARQSALSTIVRAGLVAGALDALGAMCTFMLRTGKNPVDIWKFVASGIFGKEALTGGTGMVVWGLVFHFCIALIWASIFFLLYPTVRRFISNPVVAGLLYGILVWLIMNLIVLPLSHVTVQPFELSRVPIGVGVLMVCIGLPISLIVHRYYSAR